MRIPHHLTGFIVDTDPYISCDECFDRAHTESEALFAGGLTMEFAAHLRGCPACLEEAEALVSLIAEDFGETEESALARLREAVGV